MLWCSSVELSSFRIRFCNIDDMTYIQVLLTEDISSKQMNQVPVPRVLKYLPNNTSSIYRWLLPLTPPPPTSSLYRKPLNNNMHRIAHSLFVLFFFCLWDGTSINQVSHLSLIISLLNVVLTFNALGSDVCISRWFRAGTWSVRFNGPLTSKSSINRWKASYYTIERYWFALHFPPDRGPHVAKHSMLLLVVVTEKMPNKTTDYPNDFLLDTPTFWLSPSSLESIVVRYFTTVCSSTFVVTLLFINLPGFSEDWSTMNIDPVMRILLLLTLHLQMLRAAQRTEIWALLLFTLLSMMTM